MLQDGIVEEVPGVTLAELGLQSAFREQVRPDAVGGVPGEGARERLPLIEPGAGNSEWMRMIFREIPIIIELAEPSSVIFRK
jgi:hypothetical protein